MAYELSDKYDIGVAIARGDLFSGYIFNVFGLPVRIIDVHRKGGSGADICRMDLKPEEIRGKRVAVFDKDVDSGRTTNKSFETLKKMDPSQIDLVLNYDPADDGWGTDKQSIPVGFRAVLYPSTIHFSDFPKVVERLEKIIGVVHD